MPPASPRDTWDAAARHWDEVAGRWFARRDVMEAATAPVSARLVEMARLAPGMRVLDVATGLGEPARTAALAVAPGGLVVATDLSPGMLARAAERVRREGPAGVRFAAVDATRPAFRPGAFDAVLCRFGLMALGDTEQALARLKGALVPGGRLAAAVWGAPGEVPAIALPLAAAREVAGLAPPVAGEPGPFRLAVPEAVDGALAAAGFGAVESGSVTVRHRFADAAAFVDYCRATSSPVAALLRDIPDLDPEAVWRAVAHAAERRAGPGGAIALTGRALCFAGRA